MTTTHSKTPDAATTAISIRHAGRTLTADERSQLLAGAGLTEAAVLELVAGKSDAEAADALRAKLKPARLWVKAASRTISLLRIETMAI